MGEQFFTPLEEPEIPSESQTAQAEEHKGGIFENIKNMFSGSSEGGPPKIGGLTFDLDTVFLLVLVYFLIADGEENMTETILIVAALVLFGF